MLNLFHKKGFFTARIRRMREGNSFSLLTCGGGGGGGGGGGERPISGLDGEGGYPLPGPDWGGGVYPIQDQDRVGTPPIKDWMGGNPCRPGTGGYPPAQD